MKPRTPYNGTSRKLVLAFDIGTTFSGISYCILDPGLVPEIKGVTRFPGQEKVGGDAKIPSVVYYDSRGDVKAVGGEARNLDDWVLDDSDDESEKWVKCEWFKLHLAPPSVRSREVDETIQSRALPRNKTVIDVFADFMAYLHDCAQSFITKAHPTGDSFWLTINRDIEYILTHPNGWGGAQQSQMRKAAVKAGLIPDDESGHARIHFVTEGEASLHYCIKNGLGAHVRQNKDGIIIIDAGGGTIDLSCYAPQKGSALLFEEIASTECLLKGSVFVTQNARLFLAERLRESRYLRDLDAMVDIFDTSTKLRFRSVTEPAYIKFGSLRDKDIKVDIKSGQLRLSGEDVAPFFEPSIEAIIKAVKKQMSAARQKIISIFLVGGFAASEYLFTRLQEAFQPLGVTLSRPDTFVNKAVADGAISFYLDHFVSVRVSRFTYGIECNVKYNSKDPEHVLREAKKYTDDAGDVVVAGSFSTILPKNTQVSETQEYRNSYMRISRIPEFHQLTESILFFEGEGTCPRWMDLKPHQYKTLCTIDADTSALNKTLKLTTGALLPHYKITYDIVISFGLTELKAEICWMENGVEKRSPAQVVYEDLI